jgi:hypothetical protein
VSDTPEATVNGPYTVPEFNPVAVHVFPFQPSPNESNIYNV